MGKGGDKVVATNEKKEVLIEGRFYDISNLKHPGGSVINYYSNNEIDATQAFHNFHVRSKKANKLMEHLPSRDADEKKLAKNYLPGQSELLKDFNELTRTFEKEGLFKPSPLHVTYRCLEIMLLYSLGFYFIRSEQFLIGIVLCSIAQGRCGWLMHEGGHYSLTGKHTQYTYIELNYTKFVSQTYSNLYILFLIIYNL